MKSLTNGMLTGARIFFWELVCGSRGLLFGDKLSPFVSLLYSLSLSLLPVFVIFYYNPNFIRTISPYYISFLFLRCVWSSKASFPWDLWIPVFHSECLELPFQFFSFCAVVLLDWYGLWSKHVIEEKMVKQKDVLES